MSIISDLPVIENEKRYVFTTTNNSPVSGFSKIKRRLDTAMLSIMRGEAKKAGAGEKEIEALKLEPWRFHDLRRTLASGCQRLGVRLEVSEAILNHTSGTRSGIAGVYHVYKFEEEKRAALEAWGDYVDILVKPVLDNAAE
jgi:integrase